ncbi:serine/threonine protein kinase [Candidatus Margulisiibacteriota bacterium]
MTTWQQLNHDSVLHTVEEILRTKLSNLLLTRNSYINRVYELEEHDSRERFIVKFYRPGRWTREQILEEHQFLRELFAQEIPVIPPISIHGKTLFALSISPSCPEPCRGAPDLSIFYAVFPKKGGRALDEFNKEGWEEVGRLLARIHSIGALHKSSQRITWQPAIATQHHLEVLFKTDYLLPDFQPSFKNVVESFIKKAEPKFKDQEFILLHGDCHKGNLIHRPNEGIYIVDFDDICFGPPVQDLWLLLPGSIEHCENELEWFLKGYETFRPFDLPSLDLVPLLRGMRIIHFVSWLAIQSKEPDFTRHFPKAGTAKYWNELIKELQEITFQIY